MKGFLILAAIVTLASSSAFARTLEVEVKPSCIRGTDRMSFHVLFDVAYSKIHNKKTDPGKDRYQYVYQLNCDLKEKTCEGVQIDLTKNQLSLMSVQNIAGAKVVALTQSTAVISWGPLRTFTLDLEKNSVTYSDSAGDTEGRAEAKCK